MMIGAMNHPARDVLKEIEWIGRMGFDFIDLTLEPPMALPRNLNFTDVRAALDANGLKVVGHTAYRLKGSRLTEIKPPPPAALASNGPPMRHARRRHR